MESRGLSRDDCENTTNMFGLHQLQQQYSQRDYRLVLQREASFRHNYQPPLKIQVSSPPPLQTSLNSEPLLTIVSTPTHNTFSTTNASSNSSSFSSDREIRIAGPLDALISSQPGPINVSTCCQICNEATTVGHTYLLFISKDQRMTQQEPFFPFLVKVLTSDKSEDVRNYALVCTTCYHSLIGQWLAYESSHLPEDKDPYKRIYNCNDYICYICGVTTYRKRVRSITVKDFPFLIEHPRPPGALTIFNGESVLTCLTCFESLTLQWHDYERMKVPIEIRKYNWISVPAPPELLSNEDPISLVKNTHSTTSPSIPTILSGIGLTSHHKAPVINAANTPISTTKSPSGVQRSMATVSPLYQVPQPGPSGHHPNLSSGHSVISNSSLSANRTSSFAAALRKLAKQAYDPGNGIDGPAVPQSLVANHSNNAPKNSSSSFQTPYQSSLVAPSPPVVTIAPLPAHQIDRNNDSRKLDGHSMLFDNRMQSEQNKEALHYSNVQRLSPMVHNRASHSREHETGASANHNSQSFNPLTNRSTSFQPYRSAFEESVRSSSSASSLTGSSIPSHLLPYADALTYPYNPFLAPPLPAPSSMQQQHLTPASATYRLDDPFYLDRFGLLRSSLHGTTSTGAMTHANNSGASSVPFNLTRYSDLLTTHHDRIINDERQRLLSQSFAQNTYKQSSASNIDSPPLQLNSSLTNERRSELNNSGSNNSELQEVNHTTHLPMASGKRESFSGSILTGTPRDLSQSSFSTIPRKAHGQPSASVKPLNLSSNSDHATEQAYLWRPQTDSIKDNSRFDSAKAKTNHVAPEQQTVDNSSAKINYELSKVNPKKQRLNHYVSSNEITNGFNSEVRDELALSLVKTNNNIANVDKNSFPSNDNHSPRSEQLKFQLSDEPKIISKLDIDEIKLKRKRQRKIDDESSDEESLDESDEEDFENKLKHKVLLSKVSPLRLDMDSNKLNFLETFNLTTHIKRNRIELRKFMKRRKILGEMTPPPQLDGFDEETLKFPDCIKIISNNTLLPDAIANVEKNNEVKNHFMSILGLRTQACSEQQRDAEIIWQGILNERETRAKQNRCCTKLLNNFSNEVLQKWLSNLQFNQVSDSSALNRYNLNGLISNTSMTKCFNDNSNSNNLNNTKFTSHRGQRKVILFNNHINSKTNSSNNDKRSHLSYLQVSSKDFAQEFHESVLLQTTRQQQLAKQKTVIPETQQHYADLSNSSFFKWPGIEAVMEAYERYTIEQKQEKEFLQERSQQLKLRLEQANHEVESLGQKMAELVQVKNQLDDERERYQSSLDVLKDYLRQLR